MAYQLRQINETVRTKAELGRKDFIAPRANKAARRANAPGYITALLGQSYLVIHEGTTTPAVYTEEEVESETAAYWKVTHNAFGLPYCKEVATYGEAEVYVESLDISDGVAEPVIEGPFYSDKPLVEGPRATQDLFDHLLEDSDEL
jgi:hypothetical protein